MLRAVNIRLVFILASVLRRIRHPVLRVRPIIACSNNTSLHDMFVVLLLLDLYLLLLHLPGELLHVVLGAGVARDALAVVLSES